MKLRNLHIEDYKMFKDFDIDFVDENDEALPIVVLAGVNGSGKTTILEFLKNNFIKLSSTDNDYIEYERLDKSLVNTRMSFTQNESGKKKSLKNRKERLLTQIKRAKGKVHFALGIDDIERVADEFVKTFYDFLKNHDYRPSEVKEYFNDYMQKIFNGLDLTFKYSHLDRDDNVWFSNDNGEQFEIKDLSTGEKTLLSKVMYLYFLDYKNKIILIDEPELSLHPKWQNQVLKIYENFAKQNSCQIIIATHSPHIIGSAKPEYLRVLKKVNEKIEVVQYTQSYGLEFSQILTDIMGVEYLRTPEVAKKMTHVKSMIIENSYDSDEFKKEWDELEDMLGKNYLDLKLLKLEIASRRKSASNK